MRPSTLRHWFQPEERSALSAPRPESRRDATPSARRGRPRRRSPRTPAAGTVAHSVLLTAAATLLILGVPLAIVWSLHAASVVTSLWIGVLLVVPLTFLAAAVGRVGWERRRTATDLTFSDLLPWGRLDRWRTEKQLTSAVALFQRLEGEGAEGERERALQEIAAALDRKDIYQDGHSRRVARYAVMTAERMALPAEEIARIRTAAAVHDVGKLHVPKGIIEKPGKLSDAERVLVQRHAEEGARMVSCLGDPELTAIVRHHHERFDGGGYPDRLAVDRIPLGARVIAVADAFDAMSAARPYAPATRHKRALDVLRSESGKQFDPAVVRAFLSYYSGRRRALALVAALAAPAAWRQQTVPLAAVVAVVTVPTLLALDGALFPERAPSSPARFADAPALETPRSLLGAEQGPRREHAARPGRETSTRAQSAGQRERAGAASAPKAGRQPERVAAPPPSSMPEPGGGTAPPPPTFVPVKHPPTPAAPPPPASAPAPGPPPSASPPPPPSAPPAPPPSTAAPATQTAPPKDACKHGGFAAHGFRNQGQCVSAGRGRGSSRR